MTVKVIAGPQIEPISLAEAKLHLRYIGNDLEDNLVISAIQGAREYVETVLTQRSFIRQTLEIAAAGWPRKYIGGHLAGRLLRPPIQNVVSITYRDDEGTVHTLDPADYIVDTDSEPGLVVPDERWPTTPLYKVNPVRVRYTVGYPTYISRVDTAAAGFAVTWVSGDKFNENWPMDKTITIDGATYRIAEVTDDENLVLQSSPGDQTGVAFTAHDVPQQFCLAMLLLIGHHFDNREAILPMGHNITITPFGVDAHAMSDRIWISDHNWGTS